jgi:hypothetical protein
VTSGTSERQIQRAILRRLAEVLPPDVTWLHVPNQTAAPAEYAKALLGDGMKPGAPDLLLFCCGRGYGLEVKRPGERATPVQEAFHARLKASGVPVAVVTSPDAAEAALRRWGLPVSQWAA